MTCTKEQFKDALMPGLKKLRVSVGEKQVEDWPDFVRTVNFNPEAMNARWVLPLPGDIGAEPKKEPFLSAYKKGGSIHIAEFDALLFLSLVKMAIAEEYAAL